MNRRDFLLAASAGLAFPPLVATSAPAEPAKLQGEEARIKPYLEIGDFPDDRQRVFLFFSYTCGFCAQYAPGVVAWGKTLPKEMQLVRVPVITADPLSHAGAMAYYVVREVAPDRLDEFDAHAYADATGAASQESFPAILRRMNLPKERVIAAAANQLTRDRLARALMLIRRYRVDSTPHFGIGGRFATNANFTNGNYTLLMELVNGLVSQTIGA